MTLSLITVLLDRQHSFAWRREPDFQRTGDENSRNSLGEPLDAVLEQSGRDEPISIGLAFDDIARTLFNGPSPKHLVGSQSRQTIWNLELMGHPILLSGELSDSDSITFSVEYDKASLPDRPAIAMPSDFSLGDPQATHLACDGVVTYSLSQQEGISSRILRSMPAVV